MPRSVTVRKGLTLKRKSGGGNSSTTSTLSADANARQVTRAEFMELAAAVTQLKKDSLRHQAVGNCTSSRYAAWLSAFPCCLLSCFAAESQLASDLEFARAHLTANKTAMSSLAELVIEKTAGLEQQGASELQALQVESDQRLTNVQLALERLEFRFRHQARDCQALTEQLERHQELLQSLRTQLGQTQLLVEKQQEHSKTFVETIQYTVSTSEAKAASAALECEQKLDAFQQRMVGYVKKVDNDTQGRPLLSFGWLLCSVPAAFNLGYASSEPMKELTRQLRDVEVNGKRQMALFHQTLDDLVEMRQTLHDLESLKALVQREQEFYAHTRKEVRGVGALPLLK
ncbi:hypothetical protein BBJ28_00008906 [Nothophytophthora sp. Chile5]|nr:hypothetical protein BBJ28_00008906 [Nothophytophthora sp. Chile5]